MTRVSGMPPPDPVFPDSNRGGNFIVRHWRGGYSLPVSYWLVGILVSITSLVVLKALGPVLTANLDYDPTRIFVELALLWIGVVSVTTWQLVGIWRSASHYAARRRRDGRGTLWAVLAKIAVVFGVMNSTVQFASAGVPQFRETFRMAFLGDPAMPPYFLRVMRDNTEIEITGGFKFGLTEDFEKSLRDFPRIHVVHLNSVGGRIGEAARLYHAIRDKGLITYVDAACLSACTLAYAAGRERWIAPTAQLGFHGPAFPGFQAVSLVPRCRCKKLSWWSAVSTRRSSIALLRCRTVRSGNPVHKNSWPRMSSRGSPAAASSRYRASRRASRRNRWVINTRDTWPCWWR